MCKHTVCSVRSIIKGVLVLCLILYAGLPSNAQTTVTVLDENLVGMPIAPVRVAQYHLQTDTAGLVVIPADVHDVDVIHITYVGYVSQSLSLGEIKKRGSTIYMKVDETPLIGFTVVADRPVAKTIVGEFVSSEKLNSGISTDLAEVLRGIKGVSILTTGSGDVVPSIHGMYGDRLLIVSNGVRQEAQQWSTEFVPKVDFSSGSIAVLKGAEAVRYGSDALGGVILYDNYPLPFEGKSISGTVQTQFGTNGRNIATQTSLEGAFGNARSWAWRVQGKAFRSGDRSTPHYLLNNTGSVGGDLTAMLGWKGKKGGADLLYSFVEQTGGVFYGAQMGDIDLLRERIAAGRPESFSPFTYAIDFPKHRSIHQYVRAKGYFDLGDKGRIDLQAAYQRDRQREYHYRRNFRSNIPAVSLTLDNVQFDGSWKKSVGQHWHTELGLHGDYTNNFNEAGTGVVPLIPNYVERVGSVYGIQKYYRDRWSLAAGVRYDRSYLNAAGIDLYSKPYGGEHRHNSFTYNLGAHYQVNHHLEVKTHFGTAWRAPNVSELYSNGLNLSGGVYLSGDSTMTTERNRKWVNTITYNSPKVTASIEGYFQWIQGYVYQEPQKAPYTVISGTYPHFRYIQTSATMHGVDAEVEWRVLHELTYHAQTGMIWAAEQSTGRYLPMIPPFYFAHSLKWSIWSDGPTIEVEHRYTAQQKRFDPEIDLMETTPPAYHLLGAALKWAVPLRSGQKLDFYITAENLLNHEYKEYTSAARYYAHSLGRDVRFSIKYQF